MPSACSSATPSGRFERSIGLMLSRPEEAAAEDVVAVGVLAVQPPGEVDQQLLEDALEELAVAGAVDAEDAERSHHVHRRIDVVEVPLVGGQRAVRVLEPLAQQHEDLVLRERGIEVRPGDRVEPEVPRGEPRVLPRIRHREHVEGVEVAPVAVARRGGEPRAAAARRGRRRASGARCRGRSACSRPARRTPGAGSASSPASCRPAPARRRTRRRRPRGRRRPRRTRRPPSRRSPVLRVVRAVQAQPQLGLAAGGHGHPVAERGLGAEARPG